MLFLAALANAAPGRAVSVTLPEGRPTPTATRVAVRLLERLSSQDASTGQTFAFETTADAEVDGALVRRGTRGVGEVLEARAARGARAGVLRVTVRELDPGGTPPIAVALAPGALDVRLDQREPALSAAGGVAVLGIGGRQPQTNVVYERGTTFDVVVLAAGPSPSASGTGPG